MSGLTPEGWEEAKRIIQCEDPTRVSLSAAAAAAGVSVAVFRQWVRRSEDRNPDDEPWVHEIAGVVREMPVRQAERLMDKLWEKAMAGDRASILRFLEKLQPEEWKPAPKQPALTVVMSKEEVRERVRAILATAGGPKVVPQIEKAPF